MKTVAVTGATGFIGQALVGRLVDRAAKVQILTRNFKKGIKLWPSGPVEVFEGDLVDSAHALEHFLQEVDILFHCAGEIRDPNKMQSTHVGGTRNLCLAATSKIRHWVQLSSVGVYGPVREGIVTEDTQINPKGLYETTKAESDRLIVQAAKKGVFTFSILRPSVVFGSEMPNQSLYQLINMIVKGVFFFIGKEDASANYIHIDNVIEALMRCAENPAARGQIYNLSDYRTIEEFVAIIANKLKKPLPRLRLPETSVRYITRFFGKLKGFPLSESRVDALTNRAVYSNRRIETELGYSHVITMEDGIAQMVAAWETMQTNR